MSYPRFRDSHVAIPRGQALLAQPAPFGDLIEDTSLERALSDHQNASVAMMKVAVIVFVSGQVVAYVLAAWLWYSGHAPSDESTGWVTVLELAAVGAYLIAACAGVVMVVLFLLRGIRRLRRARSWEDLIPPTSDAPPGSATAAWIRVVVMILLWVAGSVILILLRVPDGYALILGWLLPLTAFLVYRRRRSAGHA